jgi:hypothetical protein
MDSGSEARRQLSPLVYRFLRENTRTTFLDYLRDHRPSPPAGEEAAAGEVLSRLLHALRAMAKDGGV